MDTGKRCWWVLAVAWSGAVACSGNGALERCAEPECGAEQAGGGGESDTTLGSSGSSHEGGRSSHEGGAAGMASIAALPLPSVVSLIPADGEANVEADANVVITFSEPPEAALVGDENIGLFDGVARVPGRLSQDGAQVTFTPEQPLALFAQYRVELQAPTANEEDGSYVSRFTVREGEWHLTNLESEGVQALGDTVPLTAAGQALVAGATFGGGYGCPSSVRWFERGDPASATTQLSSEEAQTCGGLSIAANAAGDAVAYWVENGPEPEPAGDPTEVGHAQLYRDGAWLTEKVPLAVPAVTWPSRAFMSESGVAHLLQFGFGSAQGRPEGVLAWHTDAAGNWLGPDYLSPNAASNAAQVAFSGTTGVAAWVATSAGHYRIELADFDTATDAWTEAVTLSGSAAGLPARPRSVPGLALDGSGDPLLLWAAREGNHYVLLSGRRQGGVDEPFAEPQTVSGDVAGIEMQVPPALVFDGRDFVAAWVAGSDEKRLYTARYDTSTEAWGEVIALNDAAPVSTVAARLATDPRGNLMIVFGSSRAGALAYQRYSAAIQKWSGAQELPMPELPMDALMIESFAAVGMNASGLAAVTWQLSWSTLDPIDGDEISHLSSLLISYD